MEEQMGIAIQDTYDERYSWCYGCGRLNEQGLQIKTRWDGDKTVTSYLPRNEHMAIPGFVYGGLIASIIDCHGTASAAMALHRKNGFEPGEGPEPPRFVTASLHIDYLKPTPQNVPLTVIGTIEEIHPKKWRVTVGLYAEDTCCAKGEVIAAVMPKTFMKSDD
ncbi:PaaI family thioesterase [Oceanobacillus manasiensis]|uniref:PaaI family thioesterase n=1 Tax=Oceanobacillus manasiensis TaxID=586413 RepID=UPI0005A79450|nr:PaaI family thioesterase [Oceanobacillus manasiensis]